MAKSSFTWLAIAIATLLAGCASSRTARSPAPKELTASRLPAFFKKKQPEADSTPDAYALEHAPALYIPGPAGGDPTAPAKIKTVAATSAPKEPETTLPALTPSEPSASDQPLRALHRKAAAKWAALDDYGCRMRRRELVGTKARPEELIDAKFRREPFGVHFLWIGPEGKDRELVYVQGQHGNLMHTLTAAGDVPLLPAGQRFKVSPDSLLVKATSRAPITQAGVGWLIDQFGKLVDGLDRGDAKAGAAKYLGQIKRTEFDHKVEVVLQKIAPGAEPALPGGGQRLWCFDPTHGLPVLCLTQDDTGRELDYCCFDRFEFPGRYLDEVFQPEHMGRKSVASSQ